MNSPLSACHSRFFPDSSQSIIEAVLHFFPVEVLIEKGRKPPDQIAESLTCFTYTHIAAVFVTPGGNSFLPCLATLANFFSVCSRAETAWPIASISSGSSMSPVSGSMEPTNPRDSTQIHPSDVLLGSQRRKDRDKGSVAGKKRSWFRPSYLVLGEFFDRKVEREVNLLQHVRIPEERDGPEMNMLILWLR